MLDGTNINILLFINSASLFGKQHWVTGEYQTEELNLIPKQMENRQGTQRSCLSSPMNPLH